MEAPSNVKVFAIHRIVSGGKQVSIDSEELRFNHYRTLTHEKRNYNQLFRKHKGCECEIFDVVKDTELANVWKVLCSMNYLNIT